MNGENSCTTWPHYVQDTTGAMTGCWKILMLGVEKNVS